jgi:HD-like signal output (HDOD) protein
VVIERDIAMTAKVLQLANSAYFGRRSPISRIDQAVAYLGNDTLQALLLHAEAFRAFHVDTPIPGFDLDELHRHCARVARLATALLNETGGIGDTLTSGLLHDAGLLVLAAHDPEGLTRSLALAREQNRPLPHVERELYGVTHPEIAAHLLALWGLPHGVTEAIAGHHDSQWLQLPFDSVAAVHVANALIEEREAELLPTGGPASEPDLDYLMRAGLADRLPHWRRLAIQQFN